MEANEIQLKTEVFLSWLSKVGVSMSPKMTIMQMADGRGRRVGESSFFCILQFSVIIQMLIIFAVAVEEFGEDELIFSIPRSAVLNVNTATRNPNIISLQAAIQAMSSPWLVRLSSFSYFYDFPNTNPRL